MATRRPRTRRRSGAGSARACGARWPGSGRRRPAAAAAARAGGLLLPGALAQQRAGRLLEYAPPRAGLLLLGAVVLDDLAHPGRGDLDAMAARDLAQLLVALRQPLGHAREPVPRDGDPRRVVEDVGLEHQLVVGLGLDQHDVDAGVALLPALGHLVQALVGEQLERLVADLREAHVRDPARAGAEQRGDLS